MIADENGAVQKYLTKEDVRPRWYQNRVNAGLHVINPSVLDMTEINSDTVGAIVDGKTVKVDLDRQILKPLCGTGKCSAMTILSMSWIFHLPIYHC